MKSILCFLLISLALSQTIYENIQRNPDLSALYGIISSPGYEGVAALLNDTSVSLTLFAPTNSALDGVDASAVAFVTAVLQYHLIGAAKNSTQLDALSFPSSLLNNSAYVNLGGNFQVLEVIKSGDQVSVVWGIPGVPQYTSTVVTADISSTNGYIHIIDQLLLPPQNVSDVALASGVLNTLVNALNETGLLPVVDSAPSVTIFAPVDAAFAKATILPGTESVVLQSHVVPVVGYSTGLTNGQVLPTLIDGFTITITIVNGTVYANGAQVLVANVLTSNGVVHVIDRVLATPSSDLSIAENVALVANLSTLYSVVTEPAFSDIATALSAPGALTLFAPTNDAIAASPLASLTDDVIEQVLYYHVLGIAVTSGQLESLQFPTTLMSDSRFVLLDGSAQVVGVTKDGGVTISFGLFDATVTVADIISNNGVIHIVDTVFSFPQNVSATATQAGLSALVSALDATDLTDVIDTMDSLTIFAPINGAFDVSTIVDATYVLSSHVVSGPVLYNKGLQTGTLTSISEYELNIVANPNGDVFVNGAKVLIPNVITKNGVVHVIDTVLATPQNENTIAGNVALIPELSTLLAVVADPAYSAILDLLNDPSEDLTLFAPTNDALAGVDPSMVDFVTNVLTYHVVPARVASGDLSALQFPPTLMANSAYVNLGPGVAQVLEIIKDATGVSIVFGVPGLAAFTAKVTFADIVSSNGYIHIIDTLLVFPANVTATATAAGLSSFNQALTAAGGDLVNVVNTLPAVTIFAPTNLAFTNAVVYGDLTTILQSHVIEGNVYYSTELGSSQTVTSVNGFNLTIVVTANGVTVNGAKVTLANLLTKNGVIHVIDTVLATPATTKTVAENVGLMSDLSTLYGIVTQPAYSSIASYLSDPTKISTLWAPNNAAFSAAGVTPAFPNTAYLTQVLLYHVINGKVTEDALVPLQFPATLMTDAAYVNLGGKAQVIEVVKTAGLISVVFSIPGVAAYTATVVSTEVPSSNGVIHVLDKVLFFPSNVSTTATAAGLTSLVSQLNANGLTTVVDTTPSITVFAPTNFAFGNASLGSLAVSDILKYHVVAGTVGYSTGLKNNQVLNTLFGRSITILVNTSGTYVQDERGNVATVITANALVQNGVVHVIDRVLLFSAAASNGFNAFIIFSLILAYLTL